MVVGNGGIATELAYDSKTYPVQLFCCGFVECMLNYLSLLIYNNNVPSIHDISLDRNQVLHGVWLQRADMLHVDGIITTTVKVLK